MTTSLTDAKSGVTNNVGLWCLQPWARPSSLQLRGLGGSSGSWRSLRLAVTIR
ncbi:hypothetical protein RhoFasGS6_03296 [Rhodococcus fascians]|nr:hypothetical protein [Rhodococcus fascians]